MVHNFFEKKSASTLGSAIKSEIKPTITRRITQANY